MCVCVSLCVCECIWVCISTCPPGASTPISFIDPRGAPPVEDTNWMKGTFQVEITNP